MKMNLYDWQTAELIHSYVGNHFDEFCIANQETDISELEFCVANYIDFRDWASALGYEISREE